MSLVRFRPKAPFAGLAHLVERHLAKVEVASSSLVTRSKIHPNFFGWIFSIICPVTAVRIIKNICGFSSSGRAPPCQGGGSEFEPRNPLQKGSAQEGWSFLTYWTLSNFCGFSSSGRAPPSQGGCGEFESRNPLHQAEPGCSIAHLLKSRCVSFLPANGF